MTQMHLVFAVNRSLAAAGDVAVVGNRCWWRDVHVTCRGGFVQSLDPQSSTTCFVYGFFFLIPFIDPLFRSSKSCIVVFSGHCFL